jgi:DNA mismatch endonuclease, patch repair protein
MVDVHSPAIRSKNMRAIGNKNTRPELIVRKLLHAHGFRYRLHVKDLPGKPDLVFPRFRAVIFINGCFWHGHECYLFKMPASRVEFWEKKISDNIKRDHRNKILLSDSGWKVLVVWECAIKGKNKLSQAELLNFISRWLFESTPYDVELKHL